MKREHRKHCPCAICRAKRREPHAADCSCASCRSKRGDSPFLGHHHTEAAKACMGESTKGDLCPAKKDSARKKNSEFHKNLPLDLREKQRIVMRRLWQDPEFVQKQMRARQVAENNSEKLLESFLVQFPGFAFVGDGKKIISGKCPDFVNEDQNLIIELFGDYWHSQAVTGIPEEQHVQERIQHFKNRGYRTLVIWEHELLFPDQVVQRVGRFLCES